MVLVRDLHFAVRLLARNRGFAIAAILVVALGFGARTLVRSLASLLYGSRATDVPSSVATALGLGVIALATSALPALRAVRVALMLALRSE
jgi:hypothetical protein